MGIPSWYEVEDSEQFQSLDDTKKQQTRNDYFDAFVSENEDLRSRSPEEIEGARANWMTQVNPPPKVEKNQNVLQRAKHSFFSSADFAQELATGDTQGMTENIRERTAYSAANPSRKEAKELLSIYQQGDKDDKEGGFVEGLQDTVGGVKNVLKAIPQRAFDKGSVSGGVGSLLKDVRGMGEAVIEQAPNMILPMTLGAAGAFGGAAAGSAVPIVGTVTGGIAGGFGGFTTGNTAVEAQGVAMEKMSKAGVDLTSADQIEKYLNQNSKEVFTDALTKGAIISAVDTATMGVGHLILTSTGKAVAKNVLTKAGVNIADKAAVSKAMGNKAIADAITDGIAKTSLGKKIITNGSAAMLEPVGELAGEAIGTRKITGEWDIPAAGLEAFSSIGQSGATFAGQKMYANMSKAPQDPNQTPPVAPVEPASPAPEQLQPELPQEPQAPQAPPQPEPQITQEQVPQTLERLASDDIDPSDPSIPPMLMAVLDSAVTDEEVKVAIEQSGILKKFGVPTRMERAASVSKEELLDPNNPIGELSQEMATADQELTQQEEATAFEQQASDTQAQVDAESRQASFEAMSAETADSQMREKVRAELPPMDEAPMVEGTEPVVTGAEVPPEQQAVAPVETQQPQQPVSTTTAITSGEMKAVIDGIKSNPEAGYSTAGMNQTQVESMEALANAVARGSKKAVARLEKRALKRAEAQATERQREVDAATASYEAGEFVEIPAGETEQAVTPHPFKGMYESNTDTAASDLVGSGSRAEINRKLDSIFGAISKEDGEVPASGEYTKMWDIAADYRADIEHAANNRDTKEVSLLLKRVREEENADGTTTDDVQPTTKVPSKPEAKDEKVVQPESGKPTDTDTKKETPQKTPETVATKVAPAKETTPEAGTAEQILTKAGKPFKTKGAAQSAITRTGNKDTHEVVEVAGGFAGQAVDGGKEGGSVAEELDIDLFETIEVIAEKIKGEGKVKFSMGEPLPQKEQANIQQELADSGISLAQQKNLQRKGMLDIISWEQAEKIIEKESGLEALSSVDNKIVEGFVTPDGKVHLITGGVAKGKSKGIFLHEFGHTYLPKAFTGKLWKQVTNMFDKHSGKDTKTGKAVDKARSQVPEDTPSDIVEEEAIMYFLGETANETLPLYKRIISKIKQILVRMGVPASILNPNDIRMMVEGYVAKVAKDGAADSSKTEPSDIRFSKTPMMPQQFLDAVDKITSTDSFKKWFGKSKITSQGRPHVLYHGTADPKFLQDKDYPWVFDKDAPVRSGSSPLAGLGIFLGNDQIAQAHTGGTTGTIHPFFVKVENPLVMTSAELEKKITDVASAKAFRKQQQDLNGHDGIIISDRGHVIVFDSNQLKSVSKNSGAFSSKNPDVRFSKAEAQREMANTTTLNATDRNTGETSTTSAAKGEKLIKEMMRKLRVTSAPAAAKKFNTEEVEKMVSAYREALASANDPSTSIADKQKMAAKFATKIPLPARGKLLRMLAKISSLKREPNIKKALSTFWATAEKTVAIHLQSTMRKRMVELSKKRPLAKDKFKRGQGADFMRDLAHIRNALENSKSTDMLNIALANVDKDIAKRETILAKDTLSKTQRLQAEERLADDYSKKHLLNIYGGLNPSKNNGSQFEETLKALDHLKNLVETKNNVWRKQKQAELDAKNVNRNKAIRDISGEENPQLENKTQKDIRKAKAASFVGRMKNSLKVMQNSIQSWELLLADFARDAGGMKSWLVDHYGSLLHYATRNEEKMGMVTNDALNDKAKSIFGVETDKALGKKFVDMNAQVKDAINLYTTDAEGKEVVTESITVSKGEAGYIHQVAKGIADPAIADTLAAMNITDKTLSEIATFMGEDVVAWADYLVDDFYQEFHYDVNKIYKIVEGVDMTSIPNYVPLVRNYSGKAIEKQLESFLGYTGGGSAKKGAMKERIYNTTEFRWVDMNSVLMDHVADMTHYKAWALPTREVNATFSDPTVRAFVEQRNGTTGVMALKRFQDHFVKTVAERKFGNYATLDIARSNLTKALIGANPVIFLKQLASIPAYAADIPTWAWAKYTAEAMLNPVKTKKMLTEKSVMLRSRYRKGFERDVAAAKQKTGSQQLANVNDISDTLMGLVQLGDKAAIVGGGYAVYAYHFDKAKKAGATSAQADETAITEFEKSTERAQQSSNIKDLGWMLRGDSVQKLFTMFMTAPASYSRQMFQGAREISRTGQRGQGAKRLFIYGVLLPSLFTAVADAMLVFDGDEEDEERLAKDQWKALTLAGFNGIPIARTVAEGVWNAVDGNGFYGAQITPMLEIVKKTYRVAGDTAKAMKGGSERIDAEEYRDRALLNMLHLAGFIKGLPTKQAERFYKGWLSDEETEHPWRKRIGFTKYALGE